MSNIINFPNKQQPPIRAIEPSKGAEVVLIITPDHPEHSATKLKILAAHYWGKTA